MAKSTTACGNAIRYWWESHKPLAGRRRATSGKTKSRWQEDEEPLAGSRTPLSRPQIDKVKIAVDNEELNVDAAHFVVITGIDEDNTVHFIDPYTSGTGVSRKRESWGVFWSGWQDNSDNKIGGAGYYVSIGQQ